MRLKFTVVLLAALALALPAAAQEQRASIEGVIKDAQGGALVGATVVAKMSSALEMRAERVSGPGLDVVTDGTGTYRFPSLTPGRYEITASLSGFAPSKVQNIDLRLGQQLNINLTLQPGGVAETVQVVAESPLIAITQSARTTSLRGEDIEKMPKGRDFTTLVTQAPGANNEPKLGGISIDGSSAAENRFIIDGAETTDLRYGTSGKDLITDFVEEVQVKSSGYAAEYGRRATSTPSPSPAATPSTARSRATSPATPSGTPAGRKAPTATGGRACGGSPPTRRDPSTSRTRMTPSPAGTPASR
jgi:hypothetical protein